MDLEISRGGTGRSSYVTVKRPGMMWRATAAWLVLNVAMLATLAIIVYVVQPWMQNWYIALPILVSVVVTEWMITSETIAPIVREWIKGEELVKDGEKPSWER